MATLPPGRLTRKQIRDLACRKAGNATLSDTDAVFYLDMRLQELYQQHPWPFLNVKTDPFVVLGPTFPLPTDFLQSQDQSALMLVEWDTVPQQKLLEELDRERFETLAIDEATTTPALPNWWHADRQQGNGLLFPEPTGHVAMLTLRYRALPVALTGAAYPSGVAASEGADVPIFPYHAYLVADLYATVLRYEMDPRADTAQLLADKMLNDVLGAATPARSVKPVIPLDLEVFTTPFRSD